MFISTLFIRIEGVFWATKVLFKNYFGISRVNDHELASESNEGLQERRRRATLRSRSHSQTHQYGHGARQLLSQRCHKSPP